MFLNYVGFRIREDRIERWNFSLTWQVISTEHFPSLTWSNLFQNQVIANQLKRQSDDLLRLRGSLDTKTESENRLEKQVRESKRQYADLESKMKEEIMMARIRDAENTQRVAELTQKISGLECKVGYTYA